MPTRRLPPPWTLEELDACFVVRDHSGQQLAYIRGDDEMKHGENLTPFQVYVCRWREAPPEIAPLIGGNLIP